ncbi:hypothetical protein cypCar_00043680 [Cyprinus carpio]|nr:hypothetical protein cypCar_00043680 [Cyprinus carpio]
MGANGAAAENERRPVQMIVQKKKFACRLIQTIELQVLGVAIRKGGGSACLILLQMKVRMALTPLLKLRERVDP